MFQVNDKVIMTETALDNYGEEYRDMQLTVDFVSTSADDHPGYDESAEGKPLYDFREIQFSLYYWEVESI